MRRHLAIQYALCALFCLALILPGAGLPRAAGSDDSGWMVICGADGPYRVPAPGSTYNETGGSSEPMHADCALCAMGCAAGCGPDCAPGFTNSAPPPIHAGEFPASTGGVAARARQDWPAARPRGPPVHLPS